MPLFRPLILTCVFAFLPFAAQAEEEIVFRFTPEQAKEACTARDRGVNAFEVILSEDGQYTLMCIDPGHWTLLKKSFREGGMQQWDPVVRATTEDEARP